eukprot:16444403-Heterocapsa_arctica.AAC.1
MMPLLLRARRTAYGGAEQHCCHVQGAPSVGASSPGSRPCGQRFAQVPSGITAQSKVPGVRWFQYVLFRGLCDGLAQ